MSSWATEKHQTLKKKRKGRNCPPDESAPVRTPPSFSSLCFIKNSHVFEEQLRMEPMSQQEGSVPGWNQICFLKL